MQIDYRHSLEFAGARYIGDEWRGDTFKLVVGAGAPLGPDGLAWVAGRFGKGTIVLGAQAPTVLNLAQALWNELKTRINPDQLYSLELAEDGGAVVRIDPSQTIIVERVGFSAAHRTHAPRLSAAENLALYGKCDNLNGHGHNYVVDVARPLEAPDLTAELATILKEIDHKNLSLDLPEFRGHNVVTEGVAALIALRLPAATQVRVYETPDFYAEFEPGKADYKLGRSYSLPLAYKVGGRIEGQGLTLWVTVQSPLDPRTEAAYDLGLLDQIAALILGPLKGKVFEPYLTSAEAVEDVLYNLGLYLWGEFQTKLGTNLDAIRIHTTREIIGLGMRR